MHFHIAFAAEARCKCIHKTATEKEELPSSRKHRTQSQSGCRSSLHSCEKLRATQFPDGICFATAIGIRSSRPSGRVVFDDHPSIRNPRFALRLPHRRSDPPMPFSPKHESTSEMTASLSNESTRLDEHLGIASEAYHLTFDGAVSPQIDGFRSKRFVSDCVRDSRRA